MGQLQLLNELAGLGNRELLKEMVLRKMDLEALIRWKNLTPIQGMNQIDEGE